MGEIDEELRNIEKLMRKTRYNPQGYGLVLAAVEDAIERSGVRGHISGRELLESVVRLLVQKHGLLASLVLTRWGVTSSEDIGRMVFDLVEAGLLTKRDEDSIQDFEGYDIISEIERRSLQPPVLDLKRLLGGDRPCPDKEEKNA